MTDYSPSMFAYTLARGIAAVAIGEGAQHGKISFQVISGECFGSATGASEELNSFLQSISQHIRCDLRGNDFHLNISVRGTDKVVATYESAGEHSEFTFMKRAVEKDKSLFDALLELGFYGEDVSHGHWMFVELFRRLQQPIAV